MVAANGAGPTIDLPRRNERLEELIAHGLSVDAPKRETHSAA
jgi:hypothetical protein